ncbi:MAG: ABC transporter permease, partial [Ruthenibacterium sp.]
CFVGCAIGLLMSKLLYDTLITAHFSYAIWSVPIRPLILLLLIALAAAVAVVYAPAKRMRKISVVETINDL